MIVLGYSIMCVIFGTTFLAIKIGLAAGLPPFLFAGARFVLASFILLAIFRPPLRHLKRHGVLLLVIGLFMTVIPYGALFYGEEGIASGQAALLVATGPLFTTLVTAVVHRRLPWVSLTGTVIGLAGLLFLLQGGGSGGTSGLWPKLAIVGGELFFAIGALLSKRLLDEGFDPRHLNAWQMLVGGAVLLAGSPWHDSSALHWIPAIAALAYLVIIGSVIALSLYYWLIMRTNAVFPSTWTYVSPIIALFLGIIFRGEKWLWIQFVGFPLILGGALLTNPQVWTRLRVPALKRTGRE